MAVTTRGLITKSVFADPLVMDSDENDSASNGWGAGLAHLVFLALMIVVLLQWALSPLCENDCAGPPSLIHKLAYLIPGAVMLLAGIEVRRRGDRLGGRGLWMIGAVVLFHGLLITLRPRN